MKMKKLLLIPMFAGIALLSACGGQPGGSGFQNPGDQLGGGGISDYTPTASTSETMTHAKEVAGTAAAATELPADATAISGKTTVKKAGDYVIEGESNGKITIEAENVHLYLKNAHISNDKKLIESDHTLTITLIGENMAENTNPDGSNAIDCAGDLTINGSGSLALTSTKNAIKGNSITVTEATLDITAANDGLHAEINAYDDMVEAPEFSYEDGGWVFLDGADITIDSTDDGIQADTFVLITGETKLDITTNGGAPQNITESSSHKTDGKGIKAGAIDWGKDDNEISDGDYFIGIEGGNITINANDDAIHSNSELQISGGTISIASGDDGVHADKLLCITGGEIEISRSYEGVEAAKVEIGGGKITITSVDDGINAADGTNNPPGQANNNCHIIISGGEIQVNASGDGIDSNGSILMTGGIVLVAGPTTSYDAALDADGSIVVNGGYLVACGALGMVETPASNSGQNVLSYAQSQQISAGTNLSLTTSSGDIILTYTTVKVCQSVIISCPELANGSSYKLYGGDTELCSFTVTQTITQVGSLGNMGNPGGMPGGGRPGTGDPGRW